MPVTRPNLKRINVNASLKGKLAVECSAGKHKVIQDLPKVAGGRDLGPSPTELLLASLAGCIGIVAAYHAPKFGINLKGMEISVSGEYDVRGFLGENVKPGFISIEANIMIRTEKSNEENLMKFLKFVEEHCPISDTLKSKVNVKINLLR